MVKSIQQQNTQTEMINGVPRILHSLFRQNFLIGVDHANAAAWRTHFIESVQRWFAYVDQEVRMVINWYFEIVLTQRHQIEDVIGLRISS